MRDGLLADKDLGDGDLCQGREPGGCADAAGVHGQYGPRAMADGREVETAHLERDMFVVEGRKCSKLSAVSNRIDGQAMDVA